MIAEYAFLCGGPPPPAMSWQLVLAIIDRAGTLHARNVLAALDGAALAVATLTSEGARVMERARDDLARAAWPVKPKEKLESSLIVPSVIGRREGTDDA